MNQQKRVAWLKIDEMNTEIFFYHTTVEGVVESAFTKDAAHEIVAEWIEGALITKELAEELSQQIKDSRVPENTPDMKVRIENAENRLLALEQQVLGLFQILEHEGIDLQDAFTDDEEWEDDKVPVDLTQLN